MRNSSGMLAAMIAAAASLVVGGIFLASRSAERATAPRVQRAGPSRQSAATVERTASRPAATNGAPDVEVLRVGWSATAPQTGPGTSPDADEAVSVALVPDVEAPATAPETGPGTPPDADEAVSVALVPDVESPDDAPGPVPTDTKALPLGALTVSVVGSNWDYSNARLAQVLQHAADVLTRHFRGKKLLDVDVKRGDWPFAAYGLNGRGHKTVTITPKGSMWNQQVYQFAHELCHTLCRHRDGDKNNHWFEESIAEMASLYVLDRVGEAWKANPPLRGKEWYAKHFTSYSANRKKKANVQLPEGKTFAQWFRENKQKLIDGKGDARAPQETIALHILPMIEKKPEYWGAFYYLNVGKTKEKVPFETYLDNWQKSSPREYHPFIEDIRALFEASSSAFRGRSQPDR